MIFTDARFVALFAVGWVAFFVVSQQFRPYVLATWGLAFYAVFAPRALPLVVAVVLVTYALSSYGATAAAVTGLIALLAYAKLDWPGLAWLAAGEAREGTPVVLLGLSFLIFELIHFAVETGRGRIAGETLPTLAAFALFVPCRVAGPIKRYPDFTASWATARISGEDLYRGALRIGLGLFKKLALADPIGVVLAQMPTVTAPAHAWALLLAYGLVIYVDFSAYSDIAIGLSRMLGITVPENFRHPYLSVNIRDFWNRWHISLSTWVRDYIFSELARRLFKTPLRKRPHVIAATSYLATFAVVGAWHGLQPTFVIWGLYHGALLTGYHLYKAWLPAAVVKSGVFHSRVATLASMALTFVLVTVGWTMFTADIGQGLRLLSAMTSR